MQILRRTEVYSGRAFGVQQVLVQLPDGKQRIFDLVQHADSVSVVPLTADGRLLFVRQHRLGSNCPLLELPAGVMEAGEDPATCAARELREETGMAAGALVKIGQAYLAPGYASELMHFYFACQLHPAPLQGDADEFIHLEAIAVHDALQMAQRGEFWDSKTLAALLLARSRLENL